MREEEREGGSLGQRKRMDEFERLERPKQEARDEMEGEMSITLNSCLLARGSHNNFSTFPPTRKPAPTTPISIQAKMKVNPTPLKESERDRR